MSSAVPIACNLGAIPEADRPHYFALRAEVLAKVANVTELADGFALHLSVDRDGLASLATWIGYERVCCPFLAFRMSVEGDGPVRLEMGGAEGVKEFLRAEFAEIERAKLRSPASLIRRG